MENRMNPRMPAAVSERGTSLREAPGAGWWWTAWAGPRIAAGMTDRLTDRGALRPFGRPPRHIIEAEQVHGASSAIVECAQAAPITGCDALITARPGLALCIRTADCLPIFMADAARGIVALAHAGWRGLAAQLPARVIALLRSAYRVRASDLRVAIGPAIHGCCYEVGPEFAGAFGRFVAERNGRRTCDLIGAAVEQLQRCGVPVPRIADSGLCTACDVDRWFSLRREGPSTGRLTSLIMLR